MRMWLCRKLLLVAIAVFFWAASAQQAPNPSLQLPLFAVPDNSDNTHRNNFCDLSDQVLVSRDLTLDMALKGVAIRPALMDGEFVNFDRGDAEEGTTISNATLDKAYPGLIPLLLDEICERAGCTWRNSYAAVSYSDMPDDKTFLELLMWTTDMYDLTGEWWLRSVERLRAGVTFMERWYDGTIIMVSKKQSEEEDEFDPWGWLAPFDTAVWIMTISTVLVSAAIYWLLDVLNPNRDEDQESPDPAELTWMFATAFAGQFEFDPQSRPARLFTFSIAFWALLMSAAYTANLASFLVIRNRPEVRIESVDQAVRLNLKMCVWRSTLADVSISNAFPAYAQSGRLLRRNQRGVFEGLRDGDCEIALTEVSTWDVLQYDAEINGDCSLGWIGRPFQSNPASFGIKSDAGTRCTSLLRDVFNFHLHHMETDGTIQKLWDVHIEQTASVFCSAEEVVVGDERRRRLQQEVYDHINQRHRRAKSANNAGPEGGGGDDDETTKLTLTNMGGVFLFHGILSVLSLLLALAAFVWNRRFCGDVENFLKHQPMTDDDYADGEEERVPTALAFELKAPGGSVRSLPSEEGADDMNYFDAKSQYTDRSQSQRDFGRAGIEELRAEMKAKLGTIEEKLACLLIEQNKQ